MYNRTRGHSGGTKGRFPSRTGHFSHGRGRSHHARPSRRLPGTQYIDPAVFVNKVAITEVAEHFIPEHQFTDFEIAEELKQAIVARGYIVPTPIQDRTIPHILRNLDVVGIANTGTGKTGAFLVPAIDKVLRKRTEKILVIVPTRELALQIDTELKSFTKTSRIHSVVCVGGTSMGKQISDLRRPYNFIIGTPGRIKDLINRKCIRLSEFKTLVLDEADRMLDMGFVGDMRFVVSLMPKDRQTMFFSATVSSSIEKLISEFVREPVRVSVKTGDTSKNVEQDVVKVTDPSKKLERLHDLLIEKDFKKVLVFLRTKHAAERLSKDLIQRGFKATSIHGNKSHIKRQQALGSFRKGEVQVLVATDVAARGLDIDGVSHVINYDLPATYDDYVHRIGRTGRGDKKGKALTFIQ